MHNSEKSLSEISRQEAKATDPGYEVITGNFQGKLLLRYSSLSSQDLSSVGCRPLSTEDGSLTAIFDGRIYNSREIRRQLESGGYQFRTQTDTEVLLNAFHKWGTDCLPGLVGMFAFCIYDGRTGKITFARDPFGIKPLFFSQQTDRIIFASEIQSIMDLLAGKPGPDLYTAYHYLVHGEYDSNERTFFNNIKRIGPGSHISLDLRTRTLSASTPWWTPKADYERQISFDSAVKLVRERFMDSMKLHCTANEAVGVSLSGGVDSSAVLCALRYLKPETPFHTFSFIAGEPERSEERWIDFVNARTSSISHKVRITPDELMDDLDDLIKTQFEPFGSTSIYAQYCVFKLANNDGIKVLLNGQGADGLLAGQNGHPGVRMLSLLEKKQFRSAFAFAGKWADWPGRSYKQGWMYLGKEILPDTLFKPARKLLGRNFEPDWLNMVLFRNAGVIPKENRPVREKACRGRRLVEKLTRSLHNRGLQHLLRHGDRNSVRFSVEDRPVFLTTGLAELLYSLSESYLVSNNGQTKYVFREAMRGIVPDEILDRKDKIGFETPETGWKEFLAGKIDINLKRNSAELITGTEFKRKSENFSSAQLWRILNYLEWMKLY